MLYDKKLKFIHIPRTAGTSVENHFIKTNIRYGRFDTEYCSQSIEKENIWGRLAEKWHSVLSDDSNLWQKYKFFTIIRNPIDRLISEYYQPYQHQSILDIKSRENLKEFNNNIQKILNLVKNKPSVMGHYAPQINFLNIKNLDKIYLLNFNNLQSEIHAVHKIFNIISSPLNIKSAYSIKRFGFNDLDIQIQDMFKNVYRLDINLYNLVNKVNNSVKTFDEVFNIC
jgi:hypothetical protein